MRGNNRRAKRHGEQRVQRLLTFYEIHSHLEAVRVLIAVVENMGPDLDTRYNFIIVQLVQGVEHRLESLHAPLRHHRAARDRVLPLVHHHQTTEHQVTLDHRFLLHRPDDLRVRVLIHRSELSATVSDQVMGFRVLEPKATRSPADPIIPVVLVPSLVVYRSTTADSPDVIGEPLAIDQPPAIGVVIVVVVVVVTTDLLEIVVVVAAWLAMGRAHATERGKQQKLHDFIAVSGWLFRIASTTRFSFLGCAQAESARVFRAVTLVPGLPSQVCRVGGFCRRFWLPSGQDIRVLCAENGASRRWPVMVP